MRKDETKKVIPNISKAKKILKWKPKITLNEGLKSSLLILLNNEKKVSFNKRYNELL